MVLTTKLPAGVLIRIRRDALDRTKLLLPPEILRGDQRLDPLPDDIRRKRMFIPAVEALHIGPISTSAFSGFILTASEEHEGYLWQEVGFDADTLRVLSEIGAKWNAVLEQRHAREGYTLAEKLEAAIARRITKAR